MSDPILLEPRSPNYVYLPDSLRLQVEAWASREGHPVRDAIVLLLRESLSGVKHA